MHFNVAAVYMAAGGNRQPAAADWDSTTGLLAFGAGRNLALWKPEDDLNPGLTALCSGHSGNVQAVKFYPQAAIDPSVIFSGSVDQSIRVWKAESTSSNEFSSIGVIRGHTGSINCIDVSVANQFLISGAADKTIKIWRIAIRGSQFEATLFQTIETTPSIFPLSLAVQNLEASGVVLLAFGGTANSIHIYVAAVGIEDPTDPDFKFKGTLVGHEGWIRSLDFVEGGGGSLGPNLLLASASQDKYIRIWRLHQNLRSIERESNSFALESKGPLSNRVFNFVTLNAAYSFTFEALLLGHEDWIYTARWNKKVKNEKPQLLTAAADSSLAIWELEPSSSIWICKARLGEINLQKGSTTATGSPGGFWNGLWSPDASCIVSLGCTGSWRRWTLNAESNEWKQQLGTSGHIQEAKACSWSGDGGYLLSVSKDQTTRLHAQWKLDHHFSWHEFARPQIHGYDINCIATLGGSRFISGADEKLLRVFDEPRNAAKLLEKLSGIKAHEVQNLAETSSIPVLGLSNKATHIVDTNHSDHYSYDESSQVVERSSLPPFAAMKDAHPPLEDQLARHTLWPEKEKLYGHGYEISAVASSHDGSIVATACKASSFEYATIRIYETIGWREVKPALSAHSLTVTCIRFSNDDNYLLSVGRDRQWAVFSRKCVKANIYELCTRNSTSHSRMILGADWAPTKNLVFATAGRDRCIKFWKADEGPLKMSFSPITAIPTSAAVTTVAFMQDVVANHTVLAAGMETGRLHIYVIDPVKLAVEAVHEININSSPSLCVTQIAWQPQMLDLREGESSRSVKGRRLAVSSDDSSIRILSIGVDW